MKIIIVESKIKEVINSKSNYDRLCNLYDRWACEKEYEDWKDYSKAINQIAEDNDIKFLKATKRPFGFQAMIGQTKVKFFLKLKGRRIDFHAQTM